MAQPHRKVNKIKISTPKSSSNIVQTKRLTYWPSIAAGRKNDRYIARFVTLGRYDSKYPRLICKSVFCCWVNRNRCRLDPEGQILAICSSCSSCTSSTRWGSATTAPSSCLAKNCSLRIENTLLALRILISWASTYVNRNFVSLLYDDQLGSGFTKLIKWRRAPWSHARAPQRHISPWCSILVRGAIIDIPKVIPGRASCVQSSSCNRYHQFVCAPPGVKIQISLVVIAGSSRLLSLNANSRKFMKS